MRGMLNSSHLADSTLSWPVPPSRHRPLRQSNEPLFASRFLQVSQPIFSPAFNLQLATELRTALLHLAGVVDDELSLMHIIIANSTGVTPPTTTRRQTRPTI